MRSSSNCFKLGTESTGDFRRIVLSDCVFDGTAPAERDAWDAAEGGGIALLMVDGGTIDDVVIVPPSTIKSAIPPPSAASHASRSAGAVPSNTQSESTMRRKSPVLSVPSLKQLEELRIRQLVTTTS